MEKISPRFPSRRSVAATVVVATCAAALTALANPVAMRVDGHRMVSDVPPVTTAKGAYVPLRVVAETLGANANYDAKTGEIEIVRAHDTMRLHVGDRTATLNGRHFGLRAAPFAVRGRTMVPLAVIARAFNTKVRYDGARAQIDVMTPGPSDAGAPDDSP